MKNGRLFTGEDGESAKEISLRTQHSQHSWRRIKGIFRNVAGRKATDQHSKEEWYAGRRR